MAAPAKDFVKKRNDSGNPLSDSEKSGIVADEIEVEISELRGMYEQFFLGFERLPPAKKHDLLKKKMKQLKSSSIRQTAMKFRVANLQQKLTTYERLWERTLKEIEDGTYQRDVFKMKLHQKKKAVAKEPEDGAFHIDEELDVSDLEGSMDDAAAEAEAAVAARELAALEALKAAKAAAKAASPSAPAPPATVKPLTAPIPAGVTAAPKPSAPPPPVLGKNGKPVLTAAVPVPLAPPPAKPAPVMAGASPPMGSKAAAAPAKPASPAARPPAASPPAAAKASGAGAPPSPVSAAGGLSDQKVKAIYDAYMMAKRRCGEDVSSLSLNSVADSLRKQVPELIKQHGAKTVDFKVVIKDGKAVLRAMPKE